MNYPRILLKKFALLFFLLPAFVCHAKAQKKKPHVAVSSKKYTKKKGVVLYGQASFYANKFHGRRTANGETFSQKKMTAACNALPLGTWIQVTNLRNGKIVVVKTNDRLNKKTRRLLDLTQVAAKKLGYLSRGLTRIKIEVLDQNLYNKR